MRNRFQTSFSMEEGVPTARLHGWNLFPKYLKGTMQQWTASARHLYDLYVQKQGKPDLIHAHSTLWAGIAACKIAAEEQIPFILTEHRDQFLHPGQFSQPWLVEQIKTTLVSSKKNLAVSTQLQKELRNLIPTALIDHLPNFVDHEFFQPSHEKLPMDPFIFLTVAHLVKSKNIELLLKAFQQLLKQGQAIKLRIAGDGPGKDNLEQLARKLEIDEHVEFLGELSRESVKKAYGNAHAFILPSLYETFGVVLIEALAMGLPLIATACGGPQDIVTPDNGLLIPKNDPDELQKAMMQLMKNYHHYSPEILRQEATSRFGKQKLIELYTEIKTK